MRINFVNPEDSNAGMFIYQPMPGYWYSNAIGQLQQVRLVLHETGRPSRLIMENINGHKKTVKVEDWSQLDLTLHSPGVECRRRREKK